MPPYVSPSFRCPQMFIFLSVFRFKPKVKVTSFLCTYLIDHGAGTKIALQQDVFLELTGAFLWGVCMVFLSQSNQMQIACSGWSKLPTVVNNCKRLVLALRWIGDLPIMHPTSHQRSAGIGSNFPVTLTEKRYASWIAEWMKQWKTFEKEADLCTACCLRGLYGTAALRFEKGNAQLHLYSHDRNTELAWANLEGWAALRLLRI